MWICRGRPSANAFLARRKATIPPLRAKLLPTKMSRIVSRLRSVRGDGAMRGIAGCNTWVLGRTVSRPAHPALMRLKLDRAQADMATMARQPGAMSWSRKWRRKWFAGRKHTRQRGFKSDQPVFTQTDRYLIHEMSQIKRLHRGIGRDGQRRTPQSAEIDEADALDRVLLLGRNGEVSDVMIGS